MKTISTFIRICFAMGLLSGCGTRTPHYLSPPEEATRKDHIFTINEHAVKLQPVTAQSSVYRITAHQFGTKTNSLFLTAIEDCTPQRTSLRGRLRQLFVGISLQSLEVEEIPGEAPDTQTSVGYSSGSLDEHPLSLTAVTLARPNLCSVDVVVWSPSHHHSVVRDKTFIVPLANHFLSLVRRS